MMTSELEKPNQTCPATCPATCTDVHDVADSVREVGFRSWADRLGIWLSTLCAIHCILTPVMIVLLPSLNLIAYHEVFHDGLLVVLPILALLAFVPGYLRHRNHRVFYWAVPGFLLIAVAGLGFAEPHRMMPTVISVTGSFLLVNAHLFNRRLCACGVAHD